jgi:hypothetical protein
MSSQAHPGIACSLFALLLCGCASRSQLDANQAQTAQWVAGHVPTWAGGEPATLPPRRNSASAYPPVFEAQPTRRTKLLTDKEQEKLQADLVAARNRTIARAKATATVEQSGSPQDNSPATSAKVAGEGVAVAASN